MLDKHIIAFKEEATELLTVLENSLLELEENSTDKELIGQVFRALHTIKGSSGMFGFANIAEFVHDIENVYDKVREGKILVSKQLIDITLSAKDQIGMMLKEMDNNGIVDKKKTNEILSVFKGYTGANDKNSKPDISVKNLPANISTKEGKSSYYIRFKPAKEIMLSGTNPLALINELRELGECLVLARVDQIPVLESYNPEFCYTYWDLVLSTNQDENAIKDVFIFCEDEAEIKVELITGKDVLSDPANAGKLKKFMLENNNFSAKNLRELIEEKKKQNPLEIKKVNQKLKNDKTEAENGALSSIRVSSDKLDILVNLVGELVTIQASLTQASNKKNDPELISIAETIERLTWELRDNALNIRMIPIGTTFSRFKRLVRDLSKELGKDVELITDGAETEMDKNVIERLGDPLVHIVRNCIDHGIEFPEVRKSGGKQVSGKIHLSAKHSGANVLITIEDDGAGLDKNVILAKAIEKNLIPADTELPEKEIFKLILKPGFSTAKAITNISGRGVGMDVVQKAMESLRGSVEVKSELGKGTSITLKLPLTLVIIEGLIVRVGSEHFVLPLSFVEECIELKVKTKKDFKNKPLVDIRGELVPYISLREKFNIVGQASEIEQIVIAKDDDFRIGFAVDEIIGEHQTVIKTLGTYYKHVEIVSGATVLGDGTVALIIDVQRFIHNAVEEEYNLTHNISKQSKFTIK